MQRTHEIVSTPAIESDRQHDRVRLRYRDYARHYDRSYGRYTAHTRRLVLQALEGLPDPTTVLDSCCGTGGVTSALAARFPSAQVVGADLSPEMLAQARAHLADPSQRVRFVEAPAESLPFATGGMELVVCANALHLVPEPAEAIREFTRVLAPGGTLLILDWRLDAPLMRALAFWLNATQSTRRRLLHRKGLAAALRSAGLICDRVDAVRIPPAWGLMRARARKPST